MLEQTLPDVPNIKYCSHIAEEGVILFQGIRKLGLEGMMAKNGKSLYLSGERSKDWVKVKNYIRRGWTEQVTIDRS